MRIARDGTWFYLGTPIGRKELVNLFASIIRKDGDDFFLVTPVEKVGITVDDAPFVAVDFEVEGAARAQSLIFETNVGDMVVAGPDNPIRVVRDPETGEPVAPGETGEMVVTSLRKEASPLIRYRTHDLTRFLPGDCACGVTMPRIDKIQGRSDDMFIFRGVNIYPGQIGSVLEGFNDLSAEYKITLTRRGGLDHMAVQVERAPGSTTSLDEGLAQGLAAAGVPIVGTSPDAIDLAEERGAFGRVLAEAGLVAPKHGTATSYAEAQRIAAEIGYPVLVRPSYVLGGRGMEIVYGDDALEAYLEKYVAAGLISHAAPVLVDRFLDDAVEIDVDALFDGEDLFLGGVMEHIEEAGIHSGDSSCALPPITLGHREIERIREATEAIARGVGVRGLLNIQFALGSDILYVLEANPRASRTVPFVSKATATPLAKAAARVMLGESIAELRKAGVLPGEGDGGTLPGDQPIAVKEAVMPFNRFRTADGSQVDTVLGPEMKSTGEVMGFDRDFGTAFSKSQAAAFGPLPTSGKVFVSVSNRDKRSMIFPVKVLADLGFEILATQGTAEVLRRNGVPCQVVRKHYEGVGPDGEPTTVDLIRDGQIKLIVNTPYGAGGGHARLDGYEIRTAAVMANVPCITTVQGLGAAVRGIEAMRRGDIGVRSLQEWAAR